MYRVTKRIFSHSHQPSVRSSIDLTRKSFYWSKKEVPITRLTSTHLEKDISLEKKGKVRVDPPFSTANFFTGAKDSEAEIVSIPSLTPAQ